MPVPHTLCRHRMQVHHIKRETSDVWTLSLISHDGYFYEPGQFALVSINDSDVLRAYTLSSTPGQSEFVTLTVRRLDDGLGSRWLTEQVRIGQDIWLSDAQGDFTCARQPDPAYLFLAAGCGVTPIISMCRWLAANRPEADVAVIYSVRAPQEVIFADEWRMMQPWLRFTVFAEQGADGDIMPGRLTREKLAALAPDIARRRVMVCGPTPYGEQVAKDAAALGVTQYQQERFSIPTTIGEGELNVTVAHLARKFRVPTGMTLLAALESHNVPVNAACRAGVCGSCKTRILRGDYQVSSTATLSAQERDEGYVLACSCRLQGDVVVA
ncbi:NADH oxidoreductase [Martelella alba]|uniref:NADH oxidoreductase n=2 Tax=Martelella alba TaxID=2590451 RepID=A0ABY2SLI1_9HYPH|nr:NADH oxidoreductase [Martelella alba]